MALDPRHYRARTWKDPRQAFGASRIHGIGSFARAPIRRGEVVEIVGGGVMSEGEFRAFQQITPWYNAIQIEEGIHLVERQEVTAQRVGGSLNHSCDSNLWMADEVSLIARRDIEIGEELTVDYGLFTVQADWVLDYLCRCGARVCRHWVTGNDWQLPDVQQRYYPHFSPFINARIDHMQAQWARAR